VESLLEMANNLKYPNGKAAEGIVIRPVYHTPYHDENVAWDALSGKVVSENYKEKE
jgi:hypothetical protein